MTRLLCPGAGHTRSRSKPSAPQRHLVAMEPMEPRRLMAATIDPFPVGDEFLVNPYQGQIDMGRAFAAVGMDKNGDFVAAYVGVNNLTFGQDIFAQRFNKFGQTAGGEFRVNTFTAGLQTSVDLAMDKNGDFVVVWVSSEQDGSGLGVYAQRYDRKGVPQGDEFQVSTTTAGNQNFPSAAMDDQGNFIVTWSSSDGNLLGIWAQRYDKFGTPVGSEFQVNTFTTGTQNSSSVATDRDGNFVIAWQSNGQDGDGWGVYAQRYDRDGAPVGVEFRVNDHTAGNQTVQNADTVAMANDGSFVVAFQGAGPEADGGGQYARAFDANGVAKVPQIRVSAVSIGEGQGNGVVGADRYGNFVVSWSARFPNQNANVKARAFTASGTPITSEFLVNTNPTSTAAGVLNTNSRPRMAMNEHGEFLIAWTIFDSWPSNQICAQRYAVDNRGYFDEPLDLLA
jgi:hypothetical protein